MKTKIVRIGNSQGVRIPKTLLAEAGLSDEVEISVTQRGLLLEPTRDVRAGWAEAAAALAAAGGMDSVAFLPTEFDDEEWVG